MDQPPLFKSFRLPHPPSAVQTKKTKPAPLTAHELQLARDHLRRQGGCYHDPRHGDVGTCIRTIALALRGYR